MKYEVEWINNYYATGTIVVEATTKEHAKQMVADKVGDLTGNMQYDPNETEITVLGESK